MSGSGSPPLRDTAQVEAVRRGLGEPARRLAITLEEPALLRLARFSELLLAWGERINLTGARSLETLVSEHLADALPLSRHLPRGARRLVDVGSGAGLPGVVLATLHPELHCTLLEPREKRWAFLREARRELSLGNLEPLAESLDAHAERPDFQPYDVAVSRATWPVAEWLEHGKRLVCPGGAVLALEAADRAALPRGAERHPYSLAHRAGAVVSWVPEPR